MVNQKSPKLRAMMLKKQSKQAVTPLLHMRPCIQSH
jgi:hypothetical protein